MVNLDNWNQRKASYVLVYTPWLITDLLAAEEAYRRQQVEDGRLTVNCIFILQVIPSVSPTSDVGA
jgi:hypothetical protein